MFARKWIILFFGSFLLVFTYGVSAQTSNAAETIDKYIAVRTEMGNFNGAILVAENGKILFRKAYGFADVENQTPYTPETKHEVASISKMFTAFAALQLHNRGKLKFDDSICIYLKDCPESWKPITIENVIYHTSGIPDYEEELGLRSAKYLEFMTMPNSSEKIVKQARTKPLDFKPGEKFRYSNTAYVILSYIIEKASGQPFEEYVVKNIFKPAGMKHSGVLGAGKPPKDLAPGYTHVSLSWENYLKGVSITKRELSKMPVLPQNSPAGDAFMFSTLDDLYRWSRVMEGNTKLATPKDISKIFSRSEQSNYGFGWFVGDGFDRKRHRHNGQLPGYLTDFIRFPNEKITIIIISNNDRSEVGRIARDVSAIILGTPWDMPVRGNVIKLEDENIDKLLGKYKMADAKVLTVTKNQDYLKADLQDFYKADLIPLSQTEFYFPLGDGKAVFELVNDKAVRINIRYSGEDHIAERIPES